MLRVLLLALLLSLTTQSYAQNDKLIMNMRDADIRALIQWVSDNTGKNIIVHKDVKGKVNVVSATPLTPDEAYDVFLSVLQVNGFAAVETGQSLKIIPSSIALKGGIPVGNTTLGDTMVSVLKIVSSSPTQIAQAVKPLLGQDAVVIPIEDNSMLVVADKTRNIESLKQLIARLDKPSDNAIELITLKHANARDILDSLNGLIGAQPGEASNLNASVDERSNSIIIAGNPAKRKQIAAIVRKLDRPIEGDANTQVVYLHYVDAAEIAPILQNLAKSLQQDPKNKDTAISIESSESANALVINAPRSILTTLKGVVRDLDIRRAQVLVEAIIVEVNGDLSSDIGVTWLTGNINNSDTATIGAVNTLGNLPVAVSLPDGDDANFIPGNGLSLGYFENGDLLAAVRALDATQKANILSTPTIVAIDNEEANLLVGQSVPFVTGQATGSSSSTDNPFTTIERQDIGISLKVKPRINEGDSITMTIEQTVENIAPALAIASDIITNKREISTKALIRDDQILVLGGLISNEEIETRNKVPILGDIPLIGNLFRSTGKTKNRNNLMVFLHPVILKDDEHIAKVTQSRYNFVREMQKHYRHHSSVVSDEPPLLEDFSLIAPNPNSAQ